MLNLRKHKIVWNIVWNRNTKIIEKCRGKKVLHLWATDWPYTREKYEKWVLLHDQITKVASQTLWLDLDEDSIQYLRTKWIDNIIQVDFNVLENIDFVPDVIIFGETIEHIMNYEHFFSQIKKVMTPDTELIITTPNATCLIIVLLSLVRIELVHPDHNAIFTIGTLTQLVEKNWLYVTETYYSFIPKNRYSIAIRFFFWINQVISYVFPALAEDLFIITKKK